MDKEKNLNLFLAKLSQVGVKSENISAIFREKLMNASFTTSNEYGNAYEGSLIEIILRVLTPYALKLNEMYPEELRVDKDTLIKVCLLHHISKAVKLVPNDNIWEVEKRKMTYKYDGTLPSIKTGLHSVALASQEFGVTFTADEMESMTINDRDPNDEQARWFSSIMSSIVRQANEMTYHTINRK